MNVRRPLVPALRGPLGHAARALGSRDPGYGALRRAIRSAIFMPGAFALGDRVIGNPITATFAAFGAISTLLLVDFRGPLRDRARDQAALVIVGAALVSVGTLCARSDVLAVAAMAVLGVAIVFSGVVSSTLAGATTSLLLSFILPVSLPGPASQIPERLAGWGIAGGLSLLAVTLVWPAPAVDPLQVALARATRALAASLRARGERAEADDAVAGSTLEALSRAFLATPYRPTGLSTAARSAVRLVDELAWLGRIVLPGGSPAPEGAAVDAVWLAAAVVLERGAELLAADGSAGSASTEAEAVGLTRARAALRAVAGALPGQVCVPRAGAGGDAFVSSLDPAFRAYEASFMVDQIAANLEVFAAARARGWLARALGRPPAGFGGALASARERAGAHLALASASARNALRGGLALGLAVALARVIGVEHAFWVSFGTLSILRSNALSTGQTYARAIAGTTLGFVVGAAIVLAIGTDTTVLWALLPVVVLFAGVAPAVISFTAGQASFTVVLFILFNIIAPAGWQIGVVRIEDVALGGAASLAVGLLFWPRGAGAALGRALADAYLDSARYLDSAVAHAVACCAPGLPDAPPAGRRVAPPPEAGRAAAASRRLDDTFRTYLAERGPKRLGLAGVTSLVTGAAVVRLAGDAVLALWAEDPDGAAAPGRVAAARELLARAGADEHWLQRFAEALAAGAAVPDPDPADEGADTRLRTAIDGDLRSAGGRSTATAVRVVWTGDHLDGVRRMQEALVGAARERALSET